MILHFGNGLELCDVYGYVNDVRMCGGLMVNSQAKV